MFDSPTHWAVVAVVAFVLFFGWKQLPDMSRSLGRSLRIFKTEIKGMSEDDKSREARDAQAADEAPRALPPAQLVKNDTPSTNAAGAASTGRPRPTPNGQSASDSESKAGSGSPAGS